MFPAYSVELVEKQFLYIFFLKLELLCDNVKKLWWKYKNTHTDTHTLYGHMFLAFPMTKATDIQSVFIILLFF